MRADALQIFKAGLKAASAGEATRASLKLSGARLRFRTGLELSLGEFDRIFVAGAGKAGAAMAAALEQSIGADRIDSGIVAVKSGHTRPRPKRVKLIEAGHPVPDEKGQRAAQAIEEVLRGLNARDLLFVLVSGGASALLPAPAAPVTLKDKQRTTDVLLRAGADIFDLNAVRKHLSMLKGGRLAALAYPATVVALILSDVIGDPLDVIGSGLTAPDMSTYGDALRVLAKFELTRKVPRNVLALLESGARGEREETPKFGDPIFASVHNVMVGSNRLALDAAAREAKRRGYRPLILSSSMEGETREVARVHCEILRESLKTGTPAAPPLCLLSGGETTVTVRGNGKGGRNQEFALASASYLHGTAGAVVLSAGTDGTDGPTDAAGAIADGTTVARAEAQNLSVTEHLTNNNAYPLLDALGDLIKTGATGTNVMDLHILLGA